MILYLLDLIKHRSLNPRKDSWKCRDLGALKEYLGMNISKDKKGITIDQIQLKDIKTYVKGCSTCQQNKVLRQKKATPLNPHTLPELPWESILLDIIGLLPESNGFNQSWTASQR